MGHDPPTRDELEARMLQLPPDERARLIVTLQATLRGTSADADEECGTDERPGRNEEPYRTLFSQIDQGLCITEVLFDDDGNPVDYRFLEVNPAFEEQTGLVNAEGKRVLELVPDLETRWFDIYGRVALTGEAVQFEDAAGGLGRAFDVYAFRIGEPEERKVVMLFSDVTERKIAQDAIRESEERLRAAVEGADLGTWDLDLVTGEANHSLRHDQILGYAEPPDEWGFGTALEHVVPEDRPLVMEAFSRGLETGVVSVEVRIMGADAVGRWVAVHGRVRYDAGGRAVRITGVVGDITDRKEAEEALRRAFEAAEQASRSKSQFMAVMSHELRTPLNAVVGYADLLEAGIMGAVNGRQQHALGRMKTSAKHLIWVIDEILTLARAEAGKEEARYEEADVAEISREVASMIQPRADARGLALDLSGAEGCTVIRTDPGKVRQILLNMIGNAVTYTETGTVSVAVDRSLPDVLAVRVRDTGPGIDADDQERIFEPFTQVDSSHTRRTGGTGLGLTISRMLARLMGGDVLLESTLGEGSTFTLTLPRQKVRAAASD